MRSWQAALLGSVLFASSAISGSPANPEIVDPSGDAGGYAALDVRKAWLTNNATRLNVTIHLQDLGTGNPVDEGLVGYVYQVRFNDGYGIASMEGVIHLIAAVTTFEGADGTGADFTGAFTLDVSADTVTFSVDRPATYLSGTLLSAIRVKTEREDATAGRIATDITVTGTYVIV